MGTHISKNIIITLAGDEGRQIQAEVASPEILDEAPLTIRRESVTQSWENSSNTCYSLAHGQVDGEPVEELTLFGPDLEAAVIVRYPRVERTNLERGHAPVHKQVMWGVQDALNAPVERYESLYPGDAGQRLAASQQSGFLRIEFQHPSGKWRGEVPLRQEAAPAVRAVYSDHSL